MRERVGGVDRLREVRREGRSGSDGPEPRVRGEGSEKTSHPTPSIGLDEGPRDVKAVFTRLASGPRPTHRFGRQARECYLDYAGFHVDWEHRPDPDSPLYMQVSRDGFVLRLTEHFGDGAPGACCYVDFLGAKALHEKLSAKNDPYWRSGVPKTAAGRPQRTPVDPFGNKRYLGKKRGCGEKASPKRSTPLRDTPEGPSGKPGDELRGSVLTAQFGSRL